MSAYHFHVKLASDKLTLLMKLRLRNAALRVIGRDATHPDTKYFDRGAGSPEKPLNGVRVLEFPMPVTPDVLKVKLYNVLTGSTEGIEILDLRVRELQEYDLWIRPETKKWVDFAITFCQQAGYVPAGLYFSEDGRYEIELSDRIRNRDTGAVMFTPARVSKLTGYMEVSQEQFRKYTVPMRFMILAHERSHFEFATGEEIEADLNALRIYLSYGFPMTEANYATTRIFYDKPEMIERVRQINAFIKDFIKPAALQ